MYPKIKPAKRLTKNDVCSDTDTKKCVKVNPDIKPGDTISSEVRYIGEGKYLLILHNITKKWHSNLPPQTQAGKDVPRERYSAEWIVELPEGKSRLAHFDRITFTKSEVDGKPITLGPVIKQLKMVDSSFNPPLTRAEALPLDNTGRSFSVDWKHE